MDRKDRINQILQYFGVAYSALAIKSGLNPSNLKKMLDGEQTITDKTLHRIANTLPQINVDWLKTGEGEMINPNSSNSFSHNGRDIVYQGGRAGHDLTQTNNSEKILTEFIEGLKSQNSLTEKAMSQTDKSLHNLEKALANVEKAMEGTNCALLEMSEQRKLMDRLIKIIENKQ